jgi:hypothetical protein
MGVAIGLLESTYKGQNARIMMFCGGAPTDGPVTAAPPHSWFALWLLLTGDG